MAPSHVRAFARRLAILALVLLVAGPAAIGALALQTVERTLVPEVSKSAAVIGRAVAGQFAAAVDLGIPFPSLRGVEDYLGAILKDNRTVHYIAVSDRDGRVLHHLGDAPEIAPELTQMAARILAQAAQRSAAQEPEAVFDVLATHYNTAIPVVGAGGPVGVVHLGVARNLFVEELQGAGYRIAIMILVFVLIGVEIVWLTTAVNAGLPLRSVWRILSRGAAGDFTAHVSGVVKGGVAGFIGAVNHAVHHLNVRYNQFSRMVDAAKAAQFDKEVIARIEAVREGLRVHLVPGPVRGGEAVIERSLIVLRAPVLLFAMAEEMTRPFLPVFAEGLGGGSLGLPAKLAAALPIALFLPVAAVAALIAGRVFRATSRRALIAAGAVIDAAGLAGAGWSDGLGELMAWRALSAAGWGLAFAAWHAALVEAPTPERGRGEAALAAASLVLAALCGPGMGGIAADAYGTGAGFMAAAALALAAGAIVAASPPVRADAIAGIDAMARPADAVGLCADLRLLALLALAGIPAGMLLAGYLHFLAPLALTAFGLDADLVGMALMVFGAGALGGWALDARVRARWPGAVAALGALVAGAALLGGLVLGLTWAVVAANLIAGFGLALALVGQIELVRRAAAGTGHDPHRAAGAYLLLAAIGAGLGPIAAGAMIGRHGFSATMALAGLVLVVGALLTAAIAARPARQTARGPAPQAG